MSNSITVVTFVFINLSQDWGATPASIDNCLSVADKYDVQVNIHTDTLNESGFVESMSCMVPNPVIDHLVQVLSRHSKDELSIHITQKVLVVGMPQIL